MKKILLTGVLGGLLLTSMAGLATATTVGVDECSTGTSGSSATFTLITSTLAECNTGNDANTIASTTSILGMTGWSLDEKIDSVNGAPSGDFDFVADMAGSASAQSGKITADLSAYSDAFIVLKAGNGYGAFMVSVADTMWDWTSSKEISHVSVWAKGTGVPAVPLPAGGLLLLSGIGALALHRRKKA